MLLEEAQRLHLEVALGVLEERLDDSLSDLRRSGERGALHELAADVADDERRAIEGAIAGIKPLLGVFARRFDLACETRSLRRRLGGRFAILCVDADELRSAKLRGHGPVHPRLAVVLDPLVEELAASLARLRDLIRSEGS